MRLGELGLDLLVGDDAALLQVDQQHLAGLQPPLLNDLFLGQRQDARLGGHDDLVVVGDEVAGRTQAVTVERRADVDAVREAHGGGAVPRLHQGRVILVEGAAILVHERVARPGLGNEHHRGMRQRVAAAQEELECIVEAGGVGLARIGDGPELGDVGAEQRGRHRGLARRHPVDVAAHGVDLAVVADEAVGVREPPGREGVGGEALMHQRQRRGEIGVVQVGIIGAELPRQEHTLVDEGAAAHRDDVEVRRLAGEGGIDPGRAHLADDVELALELVLAGEGRAATDQHLAVEGLGDGDVGVLGQPGIVGRHVAPADDELAFVLDDLVDDAFHLGAELGVLRHEDEADGVFALGRQAEAQPVGLLAEEGVGNLHHDAGAVAHQRVSAHGTAVLEVVEDGEAVLDDLAAGPVLEINDEANAAGIVLARGVEKAGGSRARSFTKGRRLHGIQM